MKYTYSITTNATHALIFERENGHVVEFHNSENKTYLSAAHGRWQGSVLGHDRSLCSDIKVIELSRPHNETREFHTVSGTTKYAQPQGNEMNIKNLIPIDFSRKITPPAGGDEMWDDKEKVAFTLDTGSHARSYSMPHHSDGHIFVVSFADRPNTGKQPVGDDVVTDCKGQGVSLTPHESICFDWELDDDDPIDTWKPNHAAMLKQWQAEQAKEWPSCDSQENMGPGVEHHVELQLNAVGFQECLDKVIKPDDDKPTFTQAQADAGELPAVGSRVMYLAGTGIKKEDGTFTKGYWDETTIIAHHNDMTWLDTHGIQSDITIKPIQTAEEKLVEELAEAMNDSVDDSLIGYANYLVRRYTITLKG